MSEIAVNPPMAPRGRSRLGVVAGSSLAGTLAGTLLVQASNRSVPLVSDAVLTGKGNADLIDVLASIDTAMARAALVRSSWASRRMFYTALPGWKRRPVASGPTSTVSKPIWSTSRATERLASGSSPAIGSARRSLLPLG